MSYEPDLAWARGPEPRKRFSVKVARSNKRVVVVAHYHRVEAGVLTFKDADCRYHSVVAVFAPGHWLEIRMEDSKQ